MCVLSLLCNVATLALNVATLQRRDVSTSQHQFDPSLERRDVGFQRRDVELDTSLERRDVRSQRRDVGFEPLWNVATLDFNVAMLVLHLFGMSLRWISTLRRRFLPLSGTSRRWISTLRCWLFCPLERHYVSPERRDVALFKAKITFLFALTLLPRGLNPSAPCVAFLHQILSKFISIPSEAIVLALRHHHWHCHHQFLPHLIVRCPCLAPSTLPVGVLASVRVRYSIFGLVLHLRFRVCQLGLSYVLGLVFTPLELIWP